MTTEGGVKQRRGGLFVQAEGVNIDCGDNDVVAMRRVTGRRSSADVLGESGIVG